MRVRIWLVSTLPFAAALLLCAPVAGQTPAATRFIGSARSVPYAEWTATPTPSYIAPLPQQAGKNRTKGALWGGGIGIVAGGLLGGLSVSSADANDGFGSPIGEGVATAAGVALGAVIGGVLGAVVGATWLAPAR